MIRSFLKKLSPRSRRNLKPIVKPRVYVFVNIRVLSTASARFFAQIFQNSGFLHPQFLWILRVISTLHHVWRRRYTQEGREGQEASSQANSSASCRDGERCHHNLKRQKGKFSFCHQEVGRRHLQGRCCKTGTIHPPLPCEGSYRRKVVPG